MGLNGRKLRADVRVLLIDDEEFLVRLWKNVMEKRGYKVTCHTNGLVALEEFRARPDGFDLVVTDQSMPGINGSRLASEIHKIRNDIRIIICSGYLGEMAMDGDKDSEVSEILIKPFDISTLIEAIERNF